MSERLVKIMIMFDLRLSPVGLQLHSLGSGSEEPARFSWVKLDGLQRDLLDGL